MAEVSTVGALGKIYGVGVEVGVGTGVEVGGGVDGGGVAWVETSSKIWPSPGARVIGELRAIVWFVSKFLKLPVSVVEFIVTDCELTQSALLTTTA